MPLLGRHKSLPGSPTRANQQQQSREQSREQSAGSGAQLCESPLFGLRRQLPQTNLQQQSTNNNNNNNQNQSATTTKTTTTSTQSKNQQNLLLAGDLSSIPQQITRQQIHFAFSMMDTDSDGLIDLRDLSQMLANLGIPIDEAILSHVLTPLSKRSEYPPPPPPPFATPPSPLA